MLTLYSSLYSSYSRDCLQQTVYRYLGNIYSSTALHCSRQYSYPSSRRRTSHSDSTTVLAATVQTSYMYHTNGTILFFGYQIPDTT